jgi:hypothetical protein
VSATFIFINKTDNQINTRIKIGDMLDDEILPYVINIGDGLVGSWHLNIKSA